MKHHIRFEADFDRREDLLNRRYRYHAGFHVYLPIKGDGGPAYQAIVLRLRGVSDAAEKRHREWWVRSERIKGGLAMRKARLANP